MLRQDPVECLFQFICSSNNHISRIHGMVDKMCGWYGTPLLLGGSAPAPGQAVARGASGPGAAVQSVGIKLEDGADASVDATVTAVAAATPLARGKAAAGKSAVKTEASPSTPGGAAAKPGVKSPASSAEGWYAFPTLQQLSAATEQQLRDGGFGYRAKYITGTAAQLLAKPGGGEAWLMALRAKPCEEAVEALCELPGIGPKVAACVALFSLDKHDAIPVDTHVWQIAVSQRFSACSRCFTRSGCRSSGAKEAVHARPQPASDVAVFSQWAERQLAMQLSAACGRMHDAV